MAGWTQAEQQAVLDQRFPVTGGTTHVAYSANGTSESAAVGRTPIGATGWAAATAATPSVKANAIALSSAAATADVTVTHVALFTAATGGTQVTDWAPITPRALTVGDVITWAPGSVAFTLD